MLARFHTLTVRNNYYETHTSIYYNHLFFFLKANDGIGQTYVRNGIVVSSSKVASGVGVDILKRGGNAIDASVATAFALAVTHPAAGNIGGGGFFVFMDSSGIATTIDFREKALLEAFP